ncbi:probable ATP-dependent RNA helicase CG8611 [Anopheles cruzii]|uniref:probable ATP-dependent RNA helicase CG8611 n=1 Tax=Anopheles cruzii TaxID=68878 RepID=UPI0022EC4338|nr:probable ATP-dependent RNA helicase CG8611 [Anopheles cruzii]
MDLMLSNFIVDDVSGKGPEKTQASVPLKSAKIDSGGVPFSISFNKPTPIKPVLARKRPVAKQLTQATTGIRLEPQKNAATPTFSFTPDIDSGVRARKPNIFDRLKTDLPKVELPKVQPMEESVFSEQPIEALDIHSHTKKNVADLLHYTHLTVVQSLAIPRLLEGRDALIRAQTGSGKTLAYAVPLVEALHSQRPKTRRTDGILAVVIVPTRELALQTYELLVKLLKPYTWIVSGYLCGGEKRKAEKARLRAGLNILIGTPGRFCDHIRNTETLKLNGVRWLVLDEADRLLELGYEKDVKEIVSTIQRDDGATVRAEGTLQTVLLSATLTSSVKELAGLTLHNPVYIETCNAIRQRQQAAGATSDGATFTDHLLNVDECVTIPATVKQRYLVVPPKLRLVTLSGLLAHEQRKKPSKALVFMATQDLVDYHFDIMVEVLTTKRLDSDDEELDEEEDEDTRLMERGSEVGSVLLPRLAFFKLHGRMTQIERSSVFQAFRKAKAAVLICTDVASRGIDVPCVDLVVQYHSPQILADYVHRVGRTARAGQSGKAVLFVEPSEVEFIKYLADKQIRIQEEKIDGIFVCLGQLLNCGQKRIGKNKEQAAIELQYRFEQLVAKEKELFTSASKAFVSWVRYYSNFPKELRRIFTIRAIHMGHYAKCLGLRDPPNQFMKAHTGPADEDEQPRGGRAVGGRDRAPGRRSHGAEVRRLPAGVRRNGRPPTEGQPHRDLADYARRSRIQNTSEFDSGLGPARAKKAKKA